MKAKSSSKIKIVLKVLLVCVLIYVITYAAIFLYSMKEHLPRKAKDLQRTAELLHVETLEGQYLNRKDTHKGFFNNGYYYAEIQFPEDTDIVEQFEKNQEYWHKLPLTSGIRKEVVGINRYGFEEYRINENIIIPLFENGYYYFSVPGQKAAKKIADRDYKLHDYEGDLNYTLALYNAETRVLYVYDFDDNN